MTEVDRIVDQLQRAFNGNAWHGPALQEVLANVSATQAAARPLAHAHSIWELVLHIAAWQKIALRRMNGEDLLNVAEEEDWPPVKDNSAAAWKKALQELQNAHQNLCEAVARLRDSDLNRNVRSSDNEHSVYVLLHGVIQHNLYHAGQIVLLRKVLNA